MKSPRKKGNKSLRFKSVYLGRSGRAAAKAAQQFWQAASPQSRMAAIQEMIAHIELIQGRNPDALRLCRTTAVIKRT
jgi:hypothetical protein